MIVEDSNFNPARADHLPRWLDKVLLSSMSSDEKEVAHTAGLTPAAYFGVDRENLGKLQIDKKSQDRIYRALFVYSSGIHEVIRENTLAEVKHMAVYKLWNVFLRVLENCDPVHTQLILNAHETEQGRYFLDLVSTQRIRLKNLISENDGRREDIVRLTTELQSTQKELDFVQSSEQEKSEHLKQRTAELMESFSDERSRRITAEAIVESQKEIINDLTYKNQVLNDRIATIRESLKISMSEAYQYQESCKTIQSEVDTLTAELAANDMRLSDLITKLEIETKTKLELIEKMSQQTNALSLLHAEKDALNGEFIAASKSARSTADCLGKCLTITPPIIHYIGKAHSAVFVAFVLLSSRCYCLLKTFVFVNQVCANI